MNDHLVWTLAEDVLALCREVGQLQNAVFRSGAPGGGNQKQDGSWVSDVDMECERRLKQGLTKALPNAAFLGEESGQQGACELLWVVDPLDGTTNFLSGLEPYAISVALVREGRADLGVIYRPLNDESFLALRGQGARHNGRHMEPVSTIALSCAVVGIGLPALHAGISRRPYLACVGELWTKARDLRCFGSAASELSYVAAGHLQGFWEVGLKPWDVAAALVVLEEVGCRAADPRGDSYRLFDSGSIVAGHPGAFEAMLDITTLYHTSITDESKGATNNDA